MGLLLVEALVHYAPLYVVIGTGKEKQAEGELDQTEKRDNDYQDKCDSFYQKFRIAFFRYN